MPRAAAKTPNPGCTGPAPAAGEAAVVAASLATEASAPEGAGLVIAGAAVVVAALSSAEDAAPVVVVTAAVAEDPLPVAAAADDSPASTELDSAVGVAAALVDVVEAHGIPHTPCTSNSSGMGILKASQFIPWRQMASAKLSSEWSFHPQGAHTKPRRTR